MISTSRAEGLPDVERQGEGTEWHKDTTVFQIRVKETLHANSSHFLFLLVFPSPS